MAVTFLDSSLFGIKNGIGVTAYTVPVPTTGGALAAGDLVVAHLAFDVNTTTLVTVTPPAGWVELLPTTVAGTTSTYVQGAIWYHLVTDAEAAAPPTSWTFTLSAKYDGAVVLDRFRGGDTTNPFATASPFYGSTIYNAGTTSKISRTVTTLMDAALVVAGAVHRGATATFSTPSGWSLAGVTPADGTYGREIATGTRVQATAGATPTATWTTSASGPGISFTYALRPAVTATSAPTVNAGPDATVSLGATFATSATETGDAITSRAWTVVSGPTDAGSTLSTAAALSYKPAALGTYVLRYTASNNFGSGVDDLTLTVTDAPTVPVVNAGVDYTLFLGATFTRTAAESGGSPSSRAWTIVSGPASTGATIGTTTVLSWAPVTAGTYVLRYTAGNTAGSASDDLTLTVKAQGKTFATFPTSGIISAHHGAGGAPGVYLAPDGSMSAARYSAAAGYLVDVDMQATKDNVLVWMHDTTVDRTTSGTGLVSRFNYADLPPVDMRYQCGDGWTPEPVPRIESLLDELGGQAYFTIEAKDANDIPTLSALLDAKGLKQSVLVNVQYTRGADIQAIAAAGIKPHVWGLTTAAQVQTADSQGAWMVEVPYNAGSDVLTALQAAVNIKRWVATPIYLRGQVTAINAGLHGYVSDNLGYLDRSSDDAPATTSIAPRLAAQKIGPGWRVINPTSGVAARSLPVVTAAGLVLHNGTNRRYLSLGELNGTRPAAGSMTFKFVLGAMTDTTLRSDFRVLMPREEGDGTDANSRGYVVGMRKNGTLVMWTAPAAFGAGVSLGTATSAAAGDTEEVTLRFSWTTTTVTLERLDAAGAVLATIGPIANSDWRGPDISVSSSGRCTLTALDIATAAAVVGKTRVRVNGAWVDAPPPRTRVGGSWVTDSSRIRANGAWT